MPEGRLIPEPQLHFSAELAAAIGLEEAVMLQQLRAIYLHQPATRREGLAWLHISHAYLLQLLPFWDLRNIEKICNSLEALGLLRLDRRRAAPECSLLAIDEGVVAAPNPAPTPAASGHRETPSAGRDAAARSGKALSDEAISATAPSAEAVAYTNVPRRGEGEPLPLDFQPSEDMLELLERFHGIPRNFALRRLEDFILYWRERGSAGHAWQSKFKQHVQFQWARQQQQSSGADHGGESGTGPAGRTRDRSLEQDLTDTSWAD